jgi:cytochrome c-type biogenesis protein CcsB
MSWFNVGTILLYILSTTAYLLYFFVQKKNAERVGYYLILAGFLTQTVSIALVWFQSGLLPSRNLHETLIVASWAITGVFMLLHYKFELRMLGVFAAPLTTLIMITAVFLPNPQVEPDNLYKNFWLVIHVVTIFVGEAAFALACGVGILYLVQENAIKAKRHGFFFKRLPSLDLLDTTGYGCVVVGFTFLTVGLITGFIYAKILWGRFWAWDVKEVWAVAGWLLYAALMHQRLTVGWRGRRAAIMAIVGFGVLLFTFFGVNFLLKGHHGDFTRF